MIIQKSSFECEEISPNAIQIVNSLILKYNILLILL